jgi:hypothetical protein
MKVVVPLPVSGRLPLVRLTIERLYAKNRVAKVIAVGHEPAARDLALDLGAEWVEHKNSPLSDKWNAGFQACRKHSPDAVIFAGSSDWLSDDYIDHARRWLSDYDLFGQAGCHFVDHRAGTLRAVYWSGYTVKSGRQHEPIGIGRILGASLLARLDYAPFARGLSSGLDWSMWSRRPHTARVGIVSGGKLLSLSTDRWPNKHHFEDHWSGTMAAASQRVDAASLVGEFPELTRLKTL